MTAPFWAGLHGSGLANWPSIVVPGKEVPQQCAGAKSNTPSTADPGKRFPGQLHSTRDEQHRGGGSCKTEGQCSVAQPLQSGEGPEQLVQVSGHQGTSPAHLRARKQQVLSRIPHISRLEELEALPKVSLFCTDLFAKFSNHQVHHYYSWKPDQSSAAVDAFYQDWARAICASCLQFDVSVHIQNDNDESGSL